MMNRLRTEKKHCSVKSLTFYENSLAITFILTNDYFYFSKRIVYRKNNLFGSKVNLLE